MGGLARFTPSSVILRETFFGKNLSRARNFVARLDAATATARSRHLHGMVYHGLSRPSGEAGAAP